MKYIHISSPLTVVTAVMLGFLLSFGTHALADDYVGPTVEIDGHYYARVLASPIWATARDEAASLTYRLIDETGEEHVYPGHLAVISNQRERDVIMTLGGIYERAWIGGIYDFDNATWSWITGEPWGYTSWVTGADVASEWEFGRTVVHINWAHPTWYSVWVGWQVSDPSGDDSVGSAIVEFEPRTLVCVGFEPPMDLDAVKVEKKRALPLNAQLLDGDGMPLTDANLAMSPVLQVMYTPKNGDEAAPDVTYDVLAVGLGTPGNQFTFEVDKWQYNVETSDYTAPGTYTLKMVAGDSQIIRPTCEATFVVE